MASGKIHTRNTYILSAFLLPCTFALIWPNFGLTAAFLGSMADTAGCLLGTIVSPDMDVNRMHIGRRKIINKHKVLGWLFWAYWWPYAKLMPHRSWHSHAPIISTLIRVAYLLFPFAVLIVFINVLILGTVLSSAYFWLFITGLTLSDILHWIDDGRPTWNKKKRRSS